MAMRRGGSGRAAAGGSVGRFSSCLSLLTPGPDSYLAMSSGLRRTWRRAARALATLRGTEARGGAVSPQLFLVSPPSGSRLIRHGTGLSRLEIGGRTPRQGG